MVVDRLPCPVLSIPCCGLCAVVALPCLCVLCVCVCQVTRHSHLEQVDASEILADMEAHVQLGYRVMQQRLLKGHLETLVPLVSYAQQQAGDDNPE